MFMDQLIAFELDDTDGRDLDYPSGRRYTGQKPIYLRSVSKVHNEFINDAVSTDCAADWDEPEIGRIHSYEMVFVKALKLIVPDSSRHRRNVVDVGLRHHSCHRGINIPGLELAAAVCFPKKPWWQESDGHDCWFRVPERRRLG